MTCHNSRMLFPVSISTVKSSSRRAYKIISWSQDNMHLFIFLHWSAFLESQMDFVPQSLSPNISELSRSPGDGQIETKRLARCWSQTKRLARCWSQINDLTSWWQHEVTSQIGECSTDLCESVRGWRSLVKSFECSPLYLMVTFGCSANFTATITPEEVQETMDETPADVVEQSVPDEDPGDEIVNDLNILAEVKLPSTIRKSAQIHTQIRLNNCTERKWTLPLAARLLMQPQFPMLMRRFLYDQLYPDSAIRSRLVFPESLPMIDGKIEVFNSAVATFRAPSDISGITGMRREHIWAMPSWRNGPARYDTVLINSNADVNEGICGFEIARVLLFFAFRHQERHYPCALVHWFSFVGVAPDEDMGFWKVEPDFTDDGSPHLAIVHIDSIYRAVHLLAAHQDGQFIDRAFTMHSTLDKFKSFYVNKYADHHAFDSLWWTTPGPDDESTWTLSCQPEWYLGQCTIWFWHKYRLYAELWIFRLAQYHCMHVIFPAF